jgi:hypothetical protein
MIALIDAERVHRTQILLPGFARHDEGNYPAQEPASISSLFGDESRSAHNDSSKRTTTIESVVG